MGQIKVFISSVQAEFVEESPMSKVNKHNELQQLNNFVIFETEEKHNKK